MKKVKYLFASMLMVGVMFSCSKDDSSDDKDPGNGDAEYTVDFKDQTAQGKINGHDYEFVDGVFSEYPFEDNRFDFELYDKADFDTSGGGMCSFTFYGTTRYATFDLPTETGMYDLTSSGDYVAFMDFSTESGSSQPMARKGAVEIVSVTATEIVGKIDAYYDEDNYVNGNFTVSFCE